MIIEDVTNWTGIPDTYAKAEPIAHINAPVGRLIIKVTDARIRKATVSGYFLVALSPNPHSTFGGNSRIEVECCWFSKKPKTTWMHLSVNKGFEYVKDYEGKVISNIGRVVR